MDVTYRPMTPEDYDSVDDALWESVDQVAEFVERQGIASMLALDNNTCISQLYATEYRPGFESPTKPWSQQRPWADFRLAEPLDLDGRYLTLECYHVGWGQSDSWEWAVVKDRWPMSDETLRGKGVRSGMLHEVMEWLDMQDKTGGLLTWGLEPDYELLVWAG